MELWGGLEQTRWRVACGEESFVLEFLFLFVQAKRKTHSFKIFFCQTPFYKNNNKEQL